MTSCGKTFYLLKLLETDYKNHFENIFLICPTFVLLEKSCKLRRGNQQFDRLGRLRQFASREKPNERTRQTRIFGEALMTVDHRADATTDLDRETVSRKHFQARDVLQSKFQRHEHNL